MEEQDHAMALHLITVLLFQRKTATIVHYPGKFVPTVISFLSNHLPKKEHDKLVECQHLISSKWKSKRLTSVTDEASMSDDEILGTQYCAMDAVTPEKVSESEEDVEASIQTLIQDLKHLVQ